VRSPKATSLKANRKKEGDLSVTALYTSQAWVYGGFECADLLATKEARRVFGVTNFALRLMGVFNPGPNLAASLVQRHAMFDHVVLASGATQVIELAAGLSRRGAALSKDAGLRYVELDLPAMSAKKRELLARSDAGRQILARNNLKLEGADVREIDLASYVEPGRPCCVVAEGLFMYLRAPEQRALWHRIAEALKAAPSGDFVFDLTPAVEKPKPGVAGQALGAMMRLATGGRGFEVDSRTRDDIAAELRDAGFDSVEMLEPSVLKDAWRLPFADTRTQVLLFHCKTSNERS
jgi:O-methyltransferase involved in polyketide biosynthesis